jgi:hypothetical protein
MHVLVILCSLLAYDELCVRLFVVGLHEPYSQVVSSEHRCSFPFWLLSGRNGLYRCCFSSNIHEGKFSRLLVSGGHRNSHLDLPPRPCLCGMCSAVAVNDLTSQLDVSLINNMIFINEMGYLLVRLNIRK